MVGLDMIEIADQRLDEFGAEPPCEPAQNPRAPARLQDPAFAPALELALPIIGMSRFDLRELAIGLGRPRVPLGVRKIPLELHAIELALEGLQIAS
jgi:hypothetical protein